MGKINGCLKCLFIFFNVVFAILGCLMIFGTVKATAFSHQLSAVGSPGLGWSWVFSLGVLGISCLGIYAGWSEKDLALKIFAGFMGVGMIIMLIFGIIFVVMRNKVRDGLESATSDIVKPFLEDDEGKATFEEIQRGLQCCGIVKAEDWGNNIPDSCTCTPGYDGLGGYGGYGGFGAGCRTKPTGTTGPDRVYRQACGEVIFFYVNIIFQIAMGICFGFAVTALLGLLVSLLMLHQVKRHDNAGPSIAMKGY